MSTYFQKKQSERTGLQELLGGQTGMQPSVGTDCLVASFVWPSSMYTFISWCICVLFSTFYNKLASKQCISPCFVSHSSKPRQRMGLEGKLRLAFWSVSTMVKGRLLGLSPYLRGLHELLSRVKVEDTPVRYAENPRITWYGRPHIFVLRRALVVFWK